MPDPGPFDPDSSPLTPRSERGRVTVDQAVDRAGLRHDGQDLAGTAWGCHTSEGPMPWDASVNVLTCGHCRLAAAASVVNGDTALVAVFGEVAEHLGLSEGSSVDQLSALIAVSELVDDVAILRALAALEQRRGVTLTA